MDLGVLQGLQARLDLLELKESRAAWDRLAYLEVLGGAYRDQREILVLWDQLDLLENLD